jgi:hypothetical protein
MVSTFSDEVDLIETKGEATRTASELTLIDDNADLTGEQGVAACTNPTFSVGDGCVDTEAGGVATFNLPVLATVDGDVDRAGADGNVACNPDMATDAGCVE